MVEREPDTYRIALAHAADLVGGPEALAQRLQVRISELTAWLAGSGQPGMGTFLKVIDIILEEGPKPRFHPKKDDDAI